MLKSSNVVAVPPNLLVDKKASALNALNPNVYNYLILTFSFWKTVRLATTEDIVLSGLQIIDGVQTSQGDRVLVKDQNDVTTEGIYVVSNESWARSVDCTVGTVASGMVVYVADGVQYNKNYFVCTSPPISYVGVSDLIFYNTSSTSFFPLNPSLIRDGAVFYNINGVIGVEMEDGYRYTESLTQQILKLSKTGYTNRLSGNIKFLSGDNQSGKGGDFTISASNIYCNINSTTTIQCANDLNITNSSTNLTNGINNSISMLAGGTFNYNNTFTVSNNLIGLPSTISSDGTPVVLGNSRQGFINLTRSIGLNSTTSVIITTDNGNSTLNVNIQSYLGSGIPVIWNLQKNNTTQYTIVIKNCSTNTITSENIQIVYIFL